MQIKLKNRPILKMCLRSGWFFLAVLQLVSCASSEIQKEVQKRASLEKKIIQLEQKILDQKKELFVLRGDLNPKKEAEILNPEETIKTTEPTHQKSVEIPPVSAFVPLHEDTIADSSDEAMHWYYEGTQQLKEKKYDLAVKSFNDFLTENPDHVYSDRAQFMIMEAHFQNREYGLALVASNVLENRYPHSLKLADAIYKRALCYLGLEQKAKGVQTLEAIMANFPQSPIASIASQKLASLTQTQRSP